MPPIPLPFPFTMYHSDLFSLSVTQSDKNTEMTMYLHTPFVNTRELPDTIPVLQETLPSIFSTTCFNGINLSFYQEVKKTEIGHLFEHILLSYLCELQDDTGKEITYRGETCWNWKQDTFGTFHITVTIGEQNSTLFFRALHRSITLMETILRTYTVKKEEVRQNNIDSSILPAAKFPTLLLFPAYALPYLVLVPLFSFLFL